MAEVHDFWLHRWCAWVVQFQKTRTIPKYINDQIYRRVFNSFDELMEFGERTLREYPHLRASLVSMQDQYLRAARAQSQNELKQMRIAIAEQYTSLIASLVLYSDRYKTHFITTVDLPLIGLMARLKDVMCSIRTGTRITASEATIIEFVADNGVAICDDLYSDLKSVKHFIKVWSENRFLVDPEQLTKAKALYQKELELLVEFRNHLKSVGIQCNLRDELGTGEHE